MTTLYLTTVAQYNILTSVLHEPECGNLFLQMDTGKATGGW